MFSLSNSFTVGHSYTGISGGFGSLGWKRNLENVISDELHIFLDFQKWAWGI